MTILTASSPIELTSSNPVSLRVEDILGVAFFDVNGLPREYFVTNLSPTTGWVQIVFQALGLRSLLAASLKLEGFHQITVHTDEQTALVVRRRNDYVAILVEGCIQPEDVAILDRLTQWIGRLDLSALEKHPHFRRA